MKTLHIKKGFTHPLTDKVTPNILELTQPESLGLVPFKIQGIKPKLLVKENDPVKIGTPVFCDKNNPQLLFLSPGGGQISSIITGKKRIIKEIRIDLHENEDYLELDTITESALRNTSRDEIIQVMMKNGLWPLLRSLPYNIIPGPEETPAKIFVKLSDNVPYYPLPETWLKHRLKAFNHAVNILKKLCPQVVVYADENNHFIRSECPNSIDFLITGKYPCFDPGVILYNLKETPEENNSWFIDGQSLIAIGETLLHGKYFSEKFFIIGATGPETKYHVKSRTGAPVKSLLTPGFSSRIKSRYISGDIFRGFTTTENGYMGFYESALSVVPLGDEKEFFGFVKPGSDKPSFSRTFLSYFFKTETKTDCNTHGEKRACINCGYCESVCPVDILPQFTMKALYADDIESALSHGLMDCVNCSLCTFVCPSKISLSNIFNEAKEKFLKEEKA